MPGQWWARAWVQASAQLSEPVWALALVQRRVQASALALVQH